MLPDEGRHHHSSATHRASSGTRRKCDGYQSTIKGVCCNLSTKIEVSKVWICFIFHAPFLNSNAIVLELDYSAIISISEWHWDSYLLHIWYKTDWDVSFLISFCHTLENKTIVDRISRSSEPSIYLSSRLSAREIAEKTRTQSNSDQSSSARPLPPRNT